MSPLEWALSPSQSQPCPHGVTVCRGTGTCTDSPRRHAAGDFKGTTRRQCSDTGPPWRADTDKVHILVWGRSTCSRDHGHVRGKQASLHSAWNRDTMSTPASSAHPLSARSTTFYASIYRVSVGSADLPPKVTFISAEKRKSTNFTKPNAKIFHWDRDLQRPTSTILSSEAFIEWNAISWGTWQQRVWSSLRAMHFGSKLYSIFSFSGDRGNKSRWEILLG